MRSTKCCLKKIIGQAKLSQDEQLLTALTEVEMVINSRPLSYVSAEDLKEPLTPFHLIVGRRLMNYPDHRYLCSRPDGVYEISPELLTRRVQHFNKVLKNFGRGVSCINRFLPLRATRRRAPLGSPSDPISVCSTLPSFQNARG